jgi:hypothetical protein
MWCLIKKMHLHCCDHGIGYAYLHYDLLNMASLAIIILKAYSPHIKMHEQLLQKGMYVKVENFGIELKCKRGLEKSDMHVVITIELTIIVSLISIFQPKLVFMFSTWIPFGTSKGLFKI